MSEGRFMAAVGAVIEHAPTGRILLLQRTTRSDFMAGVWEIPSGRMKQFEELEDALRRELLEEAQIRGFQIVKPLTVEHFFRGEKTAQNEIILITYWIQVESDAVTLSAEHDDFRWSAPVDAVSQVGHESITRIIRVFLREKECYGD